MTLLPGLALASCGDSSTTEPDPQVSVEASFEISPDAPQVGEEVTLDGTGSTSQNASQLSYQWTLDGPSGSSATLDDPAAAVATFAPDEPGTYQITLEVSAEGVSDTATGSVEGQAPHEEISSDITSDRTLDSDVTYRVTDDITIAAVLTIEPGTRIEFEQLTGFTVNGDGTLVANGTESDSIHFTGTSEQGGWWNGIWVRSSTSVNNALDHVVVEYGGATAAHSSTEPANVTVSRSLYPAQLSVTNSTLRHGGGHGLFVHGNGDLREFGSNVVTDNDAAPVSVGSNKAHQIDGASSFTGNSEDFVYVRGGYTIDTEDVTWASLSVPYRVSSEVVEVTDIDMTIAPGAILEFEQDGLLRFNSGSGLLAEGTESDSIRFTGTTEQAGWWDGIWVRSSANVNNTLDHVVVEYGGKTATHASTQPANVTVSRSLYGAQLSVTNSTLRHSGGHGLFVHANGDLREFGTNVMTGNDAAPVSVGSNKAHQIDGASSFTGNSEDFVYVRGGHTIDTEDVTWESLSVPYRVSSEAVEVADVDMTIDPGAVLEFEQDGLLQFNSGSGLIAEGAEGDSIRFTGSTEQAGWWDGIWVQSSANVNNTLDYVVVEHGGKTAAHSSTQPANVTVSRSLYGAHLSVTNSTLRQSGGHGVWVHSNGTVNSDICVANSFADNGDADCVTP